MAGILSDVVADDLVLQEWTGLDKGYEKLEETYKQYNGSVSSYIQLQNKCLKEIDHQRKRMKNLAKTLDKVKNVPLPDGPLEDHRKQMWQIKETMQLRSQSMNDMTVNLPKKNDLYLRIILDGINVNLITQTEKLNFKEQYEAFKLRVSGLILIMATFNLVNSTRAGDAILHFLLVWYHCTLTIRESILIVNGSRIKGWWRLSQFVQTIKAGIIIVWPDGLMYDEFRVQFVTYTLYTGVLQFLQSQYQQGCLYRLRSLGERFDMDVTIDGFHSWMWKGLSFLLPFLYGGYVFQAYNAWTLFKLSQNPACTEWQVFASAALFAFMAVGNSVTTSLVIYQKFRANLKAKINRAIERKFHHSNTKKET